MKIQRPKSRAPLPKNAKLVFKGFLFDVYQWQQKMFDGSCKTFEKLKRSDIVNVFPVVDGKIVLTRQEQPGVVPFIGAVGGRLDENEEPEQAARRELLEETGMKAQELILWDAQQPVEKIDYAIYTFIAKGCKKSAGQNLDSGERIKLMKVTFGEFVKLTTNENYRDWEVAIKFYRAMLNKNLMERYRKDFLE